ncbi:MAG TPA: HD domain-containing protein [Acidobacteriaceae bacterium]|nr:HD domain-containing protein [Acidobacteriaceae bacterium]
MKEPSIADLGKYENQSVTGFFAVTSRQTRSKKDGSRYFALTLADRSGQIDARMWETSDAGEFAAGDIVKLRGQVSRYQDKLQITVDRIRRAEPAEFNLGDFVPKTECDVDELWAELKTYVESFTDPHLKALLQAFLEDPEIAAALREAPAAKTLHHAWIGGLLEHIVSLLGICDLTAKHYGVHRDLLLTGAVLHDIGKLHELRWGTSFDYTLQGQLLGHITIGVGMAERKMDAIEGFPPELRLLVSHLILSHHGKYEFGSPKLPMIPEAVLLHYLDDMDAKMQTMRAEFARNVAAGRGADEVTDWVRSMERPLLNTAAFLDKTRESES